MHSSSNAMNTDRLLPPLIMAQPALLHHDDDHHDGHDGLDGHDGHMNHDHHHHHHEQMQ